MRADVDLHGYTVQRAYRIVMDLIENRGSRKAITIVTGKSGQIRREFPLWVECHPAVREVEELSSGGAFRIRFRKP
jgi:DNA-nicking Smr family endonuclease